MGYLPSSLQFPFPENHPNPEIGPITMLLLQGSISLATINWIREWYLTKRSETDSIPTMLWNGDERLVYLSLEQKNYEEL